MPASAHPTPDPGPAPAAPAAPARLPQRLRRRLAALGAVGAVMVALPLVQLLRYQNAAVQTLVAERAGLDPVGRAVGVQRGLLAHRDLAGPVLRGRNELEPERRLRQGEVDERVKALSAALASGLWASAVGEADALSEDWTLLARQVGERSIGAIASEQAHGLLIEQTLQVIDLVGDAARPLADARATGAGLAVVHGLPRLAARIAGLAGAAGTDDSFAARERERELAGTEAALARLLGRLNTALELQAGSAGSGGSSAIGAPRWPLADAVAAAGASADRYFQLLRSAPGSLPESPQASPQASSQASSQAGTQASSQASATELQAAGAAALQAQWRLFALAQEGLAETLAGQQAQLEQQRRLGLVALAALAALGLLALSQAWRLAPGPGTRVPPPPDGEHAPRAGDGGRGEAGRLLQRLRGAAAPGAAARDAEADGERARPTLPPPP